jgi:tripartite-type tricarboxylate transporter receptor subunit TctC
MSAVKELVRTSRRTIEEQALRCPSILGGIAALALVCGATPHARAEDVADFYQGKTVELIVGASSGGTYDTYARALARHLSGHIPGKPNVVAKNVVGAGSLIAARNLYFQAPKDGTVIGTIMRGAVMEPLLGDKENANFDSRKFNFLASASTANDGTCIVRADAKVQTFKQLFDEQLTVGASGRGSAITDMPRYVNNLLNTKIKIIAGYKGTPETILAFERGEIEGICGLQYRDLPRQIPSWSEGKAKVIVQLGMRSDDEMSKRKIPVIWDFVSSPDDRTVLELVFGQLEFGRPFVAPPGVPAARVAALRKAFGDTLAEPQFTADIERLQLDLDPRSGEEVQALVEKLFAAPPALVARARKVVE